MRTLFLLSCLWASVLLSAEEWRIDLKNMQHERRDLIVRAKVNREWGRLMERYQLAERLPDGRIVPIPGGMDRSGEIPVLTWMLPGKTAPEQNRTFVLVPRSIQPKFESDLLVEETDGKIKISNAFFSLAHPVRGGGGFPQEISFLPSRVVDRDLYFLDRVVCKKTTGGLEQYYASKFDQSFAKVVYSSPLCVVVQVFSGFSGNPRSTPGTPRVTYRYVYSAHSPVIHVSARYHREDDREWSEVHFLHLSRREKGPYLTCITGSPAVTKPLNQKGEKSQYRFGRSWCVMSDGENGCGVGGRYPGFWDASDAFVYYLRSGHDKWSDSGHLEMKGSLYFGPAAKASDPLPWLDPSRQPEITFSKNGERVILLDQDPVVGTHYQENDQMRIAFASAGEGFDCLGILNRTAEPIRFVYPHERSAGLWKLDFQGPSDTNGVRPKVLIDNHAKAQKRFAERRENTLFFHWKGIDLPDDPGALDVTVSVRIRKPTGPSDWRISLNNRSARWGLWSSDFPILRSVVPPEKGDLVAPTGNWGGSLIKRSSGRYTLPYPSGACPVQCLAYQLGNAGLYIGAHDGSACPKTLVIQDSQDMTWRQMAVNAGAPGADGVPEHPIVIAAYHGNWWQMAKIYRDWALSQKWTSKGPIAQRKDYPKNLQELGFWMISSGIPKGVEEDMQKAAASFQGMTVGTHWYNWHKIPFDNSYPEYFPTKPGVPEAARKMVAEGKVIMPYINGRLWDRDIESFAEACPFACKQQDGSIYVEHYGTNPRNLVPMCPATDYWAKRVQRICRRLVSEVGVNAIYLDQIGAARPALCFDPSHGHPLGGGSYWADGYRNLLAPIKKFCSERGVALTTENTAEPYMDNIDAFLTWSPRFERDIPLLPAIYSGYTVYFSTPQAAQDDLDAFCAAQGRDFLWGVQPGWNHSWILSDGAREKRAFLKRLCGFRKIAKEYLLYGQLVGEVRFDSPIPSVRHTWHRNDPHDAVLPAVLGTIWRSTSGTIACLLVNTSGETLPISFRLSAQEGVPKGREVRELLSDGKRGPAINTLDLVSRNVQPRSVIGYEVR